MTDTSIGRFVKAELKKNKHKKRISLSHDTVVIIQSVTTNTAPKKGPNLFKQMVT